MSGGQGWVFRRVFCHYPGISNSILVFTPPRLAQTVLPVEHTAHITSCRLRQTLYRGYTVQLQLGLFCHRCPQPSFRPPVAASPARCSLRYKRYKRLLQRATRAMEAAEAANAAVQRRYSKEKKVGEGTYAVVYLGHQLDTRRRIAIKKVTRGECNVYILERLTQ